MDDTSEEEEEHSHGLEHVIDTGVACTIPCLPAVREEAEDSGGPRRSLRPWRERRRSSGSPLSATLNMVEKCGTEEWRPCDY